MKRIIVLLTVAAVVALTMVLARPASAQGCKEFGTTGTAELAKGGGIGQNVSDIAQANRGLGGVIALLHEGSCEELFPGRPGQFARGIVVLCTQVRGSEILRSWTSAF